MLTLVVWLGRKKRCRTLGKKLDESPLFSESVRTDDSREHREMMQEFSERFFLAVRLSRTNDARELVDSEVDSVADWVALLIVDFGARIITCSESEVIGVFTTLPLSAEASRRIHVQTAADPNASNTFLRLALYESVVGEFDKRLWAASIAVTRRLIRVAKSGQTLACLKTFDAIDTSLFNAAPEIDLADRQPAASPDRQHIQQMIWQQDAATRIAIAGTKACPVTRVAQLKLRWRDQQLLLNGNSKAITIGRDGNSDKSIDSDFASRQQARLSYAPSCFLLSDCSTNGTCVTIEEKEVYLHDDEFILRGSGSISLGRRPSSSQGKLIYFVTDSEQARSAY
jgi:hypothetical protein